jgi:hypothetical protein
MQKIVENYAEEFSNKTITKPAKNWKINRFVFIFHLRKF